MVKDNTVSLKSAEEETSDSDEGEKIQVSRTAPKVIQPPADMEAKKPEEKSDKPEKTAEDPESTKSKESTQEPEPTPEPEEEKPAQPEEAAEPATTSPAETEESTPESAEAATVDAVAGQAPDRQAEERQAEADRKKQEHLNKLVADKKYQLPIRTAKRRRRTGWLVLLLIVVLLLATGFYILRYTDLVDTNAYNLPSWLTGQTNEDQSSGTTEHTDHAEEEPSGSQTPVPDAKDSQRGSDINAIAAALESYHAVNGHYPSLGQLNDPNFRADNLGSLDVEVYQDPDGDSDVLSTSPNAGMYGYSVTPIGCDNQTTDCAAFTLAATLSDSTTYEKNSLN